MLTFALPTGRSLNDCITILESIGLPVSRLKNPGRNLVLEEGSFRYLLSKPSDVPAMVYYGAADLAIAGSDVIQESGISVTELLDTGMGRCVMAVAAQPAMRERFAGSPCDLMGLRVATKYPHTAEQTFRHWGVEIKLLKLNGSIELAPALGLSDCIFDIVQTGSTLKANGLEIIREAAPVSLRLIAGTQAFQLRWHAMSGVVHAVEGFVARTTTQEA